MDTMTRGFPRPSMHVAACQTNRWLDESGKMQHGGYGEEWDDRHYPIPYTAELTSISTLHSPRLIECTTEKLCIACGEEIEDDEVSIMLRDGEIHPESGPFHHKCAKLTATMCPHIALDEKYSFVKRAWSAVSAEVRRQAATCM